MSARRLLTVTLLATVGLLPANAAPADPDGCEVTAPNISGRYNCRYIANGAGSYLARVPIGGWRIEASTDGGETWRLVAAAEPVIHDRIPGWPGWMPLVYPAETSGALETRPGDLVNVAIHFDNVCPPPTGCTKIAIGTLEAGDRS